MNILQLQKALAAAGFDPGPIDGANGPRTRAAILAFQRAKGLVADGVVGPKTSGMLFGANAHKPDAKKSVPLDMPWLAEAVRLLGTKEIPGARSNSVIDNWADDLDIGYSSDEVPWCGLFTAHCVASTLLQEALPSNPLGARQWTKFGRDVTPQLGSVLVFWRGKKDGWKGHVGFYWGEDKTHFHVLGGNQSDAVNIKRLGKSRLLQARWPKTIPVAGIIRVANKAGVLESVTEQ